MPHLKVKSRILIVLKDGWVTIPRQSRCVVINIDRSLWELQRSPGVGSKKPLYLLLFLMLKAKGGLWACEIRMGSAGAISG